MATHKNTICWGAMMARDDNDRAIGYQGYRIVRAGRKGEGVRETLGPVRPNYQEAADDVRAFQDKEGSR